MNANASILLIPAYRPSVAFRDLCQKFASDCRLVVVDDGSGNSYADLFQEIGEIPQVTVLQNAVNLGKGAALKHGINWILCHTSASGVVTADCDGQHLKEDVDSVRALLDRGRGESFILGVRGFDGKVPFRSRFGNGLTKLLFKFFVGVGISDTQTGLRGIPRSLMFHVLGIKANRYDYELSMLVVAKDHGFRFQEVPIQTVYIDDNRGSHFNPVLDSMRIYFVFARFLASSLATMVADYLVFSIAFLGFHLALFPSFLWARSFAVVVNFLLVKKFVFRFEEGTIQPLVKFLGLVGVMLGVCYWMVLSLHERFGIPVLAAKALAEGSMYLGNFLIQREFIFRQRKPT